MAKSTGSRHLSGIILTGFKFGLSAVILYYLFYRFNYRLLLSQLRPGGASTVAVLLASGVLVWIVEYCRFCLALTPVTRSVKRDLLVRAFFTGYAMRFILPGGHGEIGKMLFVPGSNTGKVVAYLMDKVSFIAVVLVSFVISFWYLFPGKRFYLFIIPALILGGFLLIKLLKLDQIVKRYFLINYPFLKISYRALVLSLIQFVIVIFQYWYLLHSTGIPSKVVAGVVSIVLTVIMVPVSIAGLGLREWASWKLFQNFRVPQELALATPLMIFTVNVLIPAIVGTIVFLFIRSGSFKDLSRRASKILEIGRNKLSK
jgi:hypothetical protein